MGGKWTDFHGDEERNQRNDGDARETIMDETRAEFEPAEKEQDGECGQEPEKELGEGWRCTVHASGMLIIDF